LRPQQRAYGAVIEGHAALVRRDWVAAFDAFRRATQLADLWYARFGLGVAYVEAGEFAAALSELELCQKRQGEAVALFLDDFPTVTRKQALAALEHAKEALLSDARLVR